LDRKDIVDAHKHMQSIALENKTVTYQNPGLEY
jgi:hypothetical protein